MNKKITYNWSSLIQFFEKMNYIHNGLTIPFIIGVIKLLEGNKIVVSQLIAELANMKNESRATIMKCGNIGEFVVGVMDVESESMYRKYPQSLFMEYDNLAVTDNSLNDCSSVFDLIAFMEDRYGQTIEDEKYSKNAGLWTKFTEEDIERINSFKSSMS
ncbi:hypothetical protein ACXR6G_11505 [Ancylomarina sp. YFZ004]